MDVTVETLTPLHCVEVVSYHDRAHQYICACGMRGHIWWHLDSAEAEGQNHHSWLEPRKGTF